MVRRSAAGAELRSGAWTTKNGSALWRRERRNTDDRNPVVRLKNCESERRFDRPVRQTRRALDYSTVFCLCVSSSSSSLLSVLVWRTVRSSGFSLKVKRIS